MLKITSFTTFTGKSGKPSENIAGTLSVDTVCVPVSDLHCQVASFLQDSDIHLSLKHFLTACCLESLGVMSRTSVPVFHNGQEDHHTHRTLMLSHWQQKHSINFFDIVQCPHLHQLTV